VVKRCRFFGYSFVSAVLLFLVSCNLESYRIQQSFYDNVDQIIKTIDSCEQLGQFYEEVLDSIPYKITDYENLYYHCFFPSIRLINDNLIRNSVEELGVDASDLSYFIIALAHSRKNNNKLNDNRLMLVAKEFKYQIYRHVKSQDDAYNDLFIAKARSVNLSSGDKVRVTFYKKASDSKDTLYIEGYSWFPNESPIETLVSVEGFVDQVFIHPEDGYPIYLQLRLNDPNYSYFVWNDSVYTNGTNFPIDLLHYGGDIVLIKEN